VNFALLALHHVYDVLSSKFLTPRYERFIILLVKHNISIRTRRVIVSNMHLFERTILNYIKFICIKS